MSDVPFAKVDIRDEDIDIVREVLKSGWLTHGQHTTDFENEFAAFTQSKHGITVSSCTAGLHLACLALGSRLGDEVIVPAMTHTATAHAVEYTGANAVFSDVCPLYGNVTAATISEKITPKTKGVIVVHMAGFSCPMDEIKTLCDKHKLFLIEDCAHAIGTKFNGKHVGTFGSVGVFSFYPTKQITTGEGGMVICNDDTLAHQIKTSKAFGIDTPPEKRTMPGVYDVQSLGYNYRMTDFQAAIGLAQFRRYPDALTRRHQNARYFTKMLAESNSLSAKCPQYDESSSYFLFQVLLDSRHHRNETVKYLKSHQVGCSIHYATPVPLLTYYQKKYGFTEEQFPNAVSYANRSLSLPVHPDISHSDIDVVIQTLQCAHNAIEINETVTAN